MGIKPGDIMTLTIINQAHFFASCLVARGDQPMEQYMHEWRGFMQCTEEERIVFLGMMLRKEWGPHIIKDYLFLLDGKEEEILKRYRAGKLVQV